MRRVPFGVRPLEATSRGVCGSGGSPADGHGHVDPLRTRRVVEQPSPGVALPPCADEVRPTFTALSVRLRCRDGLRVAPRLARPPGEPAPASAGAHRKRHPPPMILSHVVVDGSNIATEGRTTPSLRQLDEAVQAFLAEHPVETLTVVVDATFPNRIAGSERDGVRGGAPGRRAGHATGRCHRPR